MKKEEIKKCYGKAIKKPVEVDWFYYNNNNNINDLIDWVNSFHDLFIDHFDYELYTQSNKDKLRVNTLEGTSYNVPNGYYIIRGIKGEYYPIEPQIFNETYNKI